MSDILKISKFSSSFQKLPARTVNDLKKSTGNSFKMQGQYFKETNEILSQSTTLDSEHIFTIPNSNGYTGHMWLEIKGTGVSVYDIGVWGAANCLKEVKADHGNRDMVQYTGSDLVKFIHLANKDTRVLAALQEMAGSGDTDTNTMIIPILAPGSNLKYSYDSYDARAPAWPIGAINTPMDIKVTLNTGAFISKTNAFQLSSIKLKYISYTLDSDNIANTKPTKSGIYYTWNYFDILSNEYAVTLTDATEAQFTIDNVITQGLLDSVIIDVLDRTTKVADKEYHDTEPIDELELITDGRKTIYEHSSTQEGQLNCLRDWKVNNKIYGSASTFGYFYPMGITGRPDLSSISGNIGTKGLNLNDNKPTVKLTCTTLTNSGTAHTVRVIGMYKALYQVANNKTATTERYI